MNTRSKGKLNYLAGPALMMDAKMLRLALAIHRLASDMTSMAKKEGTQVRVRLTFSQRYGKETKNHNAITKLDKTMNGLVTRVTQAENRISDAEDRLVGLDKTVLQLRKQNEYLLEKVDQLENYSRCNNIRIINLPEGCEGTNPVKFFTDWLPATLGTDNFPDPITIEQVHRALYPRPPPDKKPRPIIIRLLRYQDRERVLRAAASKERNTIPHDGTPVMLFPDMSPAVARRRREYNQVKKELAARKIPFALLHPATLRILHGGQRRFFKTPKEAMSFIHKLHPEDEDEPE